MATKTLYFKNAAPSGASTSLSLQDGGTAPTGAITTTGWTVGTRAVGQTSAMLAGTKRLATTFTAPDSIPSFTATSSWRSENALAGTFTNANWSFAFRFRAAVLSSAQSVAAKFRVWKSANADGSGATELTSGVQTASATGVLSAGATSSSSFSWSPGAVLSFLNEYLWIQCELSIAIAGTNASADAMFYVDSSGVVTTSDFAPSVFGTLAATEGVDTALFDDKIIGTLAAWEAAAVSPTADDDTTRFTADDDTAPPTADADNAGDVGGFTGTVATVVTGVSGTLAATDVTDTSTFAGLVGLTGTLAATEGSVPFATWNPADSLNITLSNGNRTAVSQATSGGVRANSGLSSGKVYWEFTVNTKTNNNTVVGLARSTVGLANISGLGTTNAAVVFGSGNININASFQGSLGALAPSGDVIGIAADISGGLIWFRKAPSGNWNGSGTANPATGVGGFSISAITGVPLYPILSTTNTAGETVTGNFGASAFVGAVPAGFVSGLTGGAATGDTASFTGTVAFPALTGTLAATEGADTSAFTGTVGWAGTLAATEGVETASFGGSVAWPVLSGTIAATEASQGTAAFTGSVEWHGTLAATETTQDVFAATGTVANLRIGILDAVEASPLRADSELYTADDNITRNNDTFGGDTAEFRVFIPCFGSLHVDEESDVAAFPGEVFDGVTRIGVLEAHEDRFPVGLWPTAELHGLHRR